MRLSDKYFERAYEEANIQQKMEELQAEGYQVGRNPYFDLVAKKDGRTKVYEFKYRSRQQKSNELKGLLQKAQEIDAELTVVYMLHPMRDSIEFDDLGEIMLQHFNEDFPDELDALSTHTRLDEVYIESITDIHLDEKAIQVTGEASLSVSLQYGSDREQEEDDEDMEMTFPMDYTVTLNWNREIVDLEYEIDTDGFYE